MNELNLPEKALDDIRNNDNFEIYSNKVMKQEEVVDYKEVQEEEEETHRIERPSKRKKL
jgi:hypothetical protein